MGFLNRLLGRTKQEEQEAAQPAPVQCPHTALVPRWDSLEDMGKADKVSSYTCTACNRTFTPAEAAPYLG